MILTRSPRKWNECGAQPLCGPVERHGLVLVPEHRREAVPASEPEICEGAREARSPIEQLDKAEAHSAVDDRFAFGVSCGRVLEAAGEVHELPATSAIASTIGS